MKRILLPIILAACLSLACCKDSATSDQVQFVDRDIALSPESMSNPLRLIIEITETGKLRLNKIETGTIADLTILTERLKTIFSDREKALISEREIIIDPQGFSDEDLEKLIESLAEAKASPIEVINSSHRF